MIIENEFARWADVSSPMLTAAAKARVAVWDRIATNPAHLRRVQEQTLRVNCQAAAASEHGRLHGLNSIKTHDDLKARVPLKAYDDYAPYIERLHRGERDVLLPGLIPYLARSAGSTRIAKVKELPITRQQIKWQQRQAFDILARYLVLSKDATFTRGFTLGYLPPPLVETDEESNHKVGLTINPGLMQLHMPKISRALSLPHSPIREISDQDERLTAIAEAYLDHDVHAIAGTTCWFTVLFDRVLEAARARGRHVETIRDVWPNLQGLFGGGVRAEAYRSILDERVGRHVTLIDTYNATEGGCFAVSDRDDESSMLVIPDRGVFYEFIPRAQHGKADAERIPLWAVQPDVDYSVALTTSSGLISYLIGDVVRFTSVFPHRLVFSSRVGGELAIVHEATSARQIENAVRAAAEEHRCTLVDFAASAELCEGNATANAPANAKAVGRYLLFAEFERAPEDGGAAFAASVDRALHNENWLYRIHRTRDVGLLPLEVIPLARGATQRFARAVGRHGLQQKFPRVVLPEDRPTLRILRSEML